MEDDNVQAGETAAPWSGEGRADEILVRGYSLRVEGGEPARPRGGGAKRFQQSLAYSDRLDTAWFAIVEHLYSAEVAPRPNELIRKAWKGMRDQAEDEWRTHGIARAGVVEGDTTMPNFWRYWWPSMRPTSSPEEGVVDRMALRQIWSTLNPTHRRLLLALAIHDDYGLAAESLGEHAGRTGRICRRPGPSFWVGGIREKPSRVWGVDRRRAGCSTRPRYVTSTHRRMIRRRNAADAAGEPPAKSG